MEKILPTQSKKEKEEIYIKNMAKKMTKQQNIKYCKALDFICVTLGYDNWKSFKNI